MLQLDVASATPHAFMTLSGCTDLLLWPIVDSYQSMSTCSGKFGRTLHTCTSFGIDAGVHPQIRSFPEGKWWMSN